MGEAEGAIGPARRPGSVVQSGAPAASPGAADTMPRDQLGIFVRSPVAGRVKTRLCPPLTPETAKTLYLAFLQDITSRLTRSRYRPTIFLDGDPTAETRNIFPPSWRVVPQSGPTLGDRLRSAFEVLLAPGGSRAVIIGSDSPDLPVSMLKRAFRLLKHRDVVLGPAVDGGYTLIGLRAPAPVLFEGVSWGEATVFDETVRAAERAGHSLSLLPPWYDVDDAPSLRLLDAMCRARRVAGGERLPHVEGVLDRLREDD